MDVIYKLLHNLLYCIKNLNSEEYQILVFFSRTMEQQSFAHIGHRLHRRYSCIVIPSSVSKVRNVYLRHRYSREVASHFFWYAAVIEWSWDMLQ